MRETSAAITALRAALAQQDEPVEVAERERVASQWDGCVTHQLDTFGPVDIGASIRAGELVEAQQDEPQGCATEEDCTKQPWCRIRGECLRKQAEPVEPVAWVNQANLASARLTRDRGGQGDTHTWSETRSNYHGVPLYTAPSQRKPLTEKEMYIVEEEARKNFRLAQAGPRGQMITYWDSLTPWLIRAVERAHGIKE
jgi:hypothetical protein